jgi:signal-transduction protein with cAMP-binding, CBS, and nucleotidyltransferase domain
MRPVHELLKNRPSDIWSLSSGLSVFEALKQLAEHNVGAMMVIDDGKLTGIFSERDYTRKIALAGRSSKDTLVREIMTSPVISVGAKTGTKDCMAMMSQKKIRHLPITDGDVVLGMISIRDIMDDIIADHESTISQLQSYITS